jgi:hypothetical protein
MQAGGTHTGCDIGSNLQESQAGVDMDTAAQSASCACVAAAAFELLPDCIWSMTQEVAAKVQVSCSFSGCPWTHACGC